MTVIDLNRDQYLELEKLGLGAFAPLQGFMNEEQFRSVVDSMHLPDGNVFTLPVVLDVPADRTGELRGGQPVTLTYQGAEVGRLAPESLFSCDKTAVAGTIFGTTDRKHPGVASLYGMADMFVGGPVTLLRRPDFDISSFELTPAETKALFAERGWKTVAGFQTRNVPHRAHEYLQRVALELVDGLFIQPLVGRKKAGDYTPQSIMAGYRALIDNFFPKDRVVLGILSTSMRYAGPREAIFHAIVRRNYGCTHFIVGRDHAGVGSYYEKYAAHALARKFEGELGIEILRLSGPYYCGACEGIVTEKTCPHMNDSPHAVQPINGTDMRAILFGGREPDPRLMRQKVVDSLRGIPLFIDESET